MRYVIATLIRVYQATLSPDHGMLRGRFPHGYCRFYPSCSEYSKIIILKHGIFRGGALVVRRVLRCNPFSVPRVDLPV